jgi:hypothetical protein
LDILIVTLAWELDASRPYVLPLVVKFANSQFPPDVVLTW